MAEEEASGRVPIVWVPTRRHFSALFDRLQSSSRLSHHVQNHSTRATASIARKM
jgi:hypothetical protein